MSRIHLIVAIVSFFCAAPIVAQDINIDFGTHFDKPDAAYGGAGQPGEWNMVAAGSMTTPPVPLLDADGNGTTALLSFPFSMITIPEGYSDIASVVLNDEALIEDGFWASDIFERIHITGLENGFYNLIMYGIVTNDPTAKTEFVGGSWFSSIAVGGLWRGSFEEGTTHAMKLVEVKDGKLSIDFVSGVWLNYGFFSGMQLNKLETSLIADNDEVSAAQGGTIYFALTAGADQGFRNYLILGGVTGSTPGTALPGGYAILPVNWDVFTDLGLSLVNSPVFSGFMGQLSASGLGSAHLSVPKLPPIAVGVVMSYAYCCNNPFDYVSNPVEIEIIN